MFLFVLQADLKMDFDIRLDGFRLVFALCSLFVTLVLVLCSLLFLLLRTDPTTNFDMRLDSARFFVRVVFALILDRTYEYTFNC